MAHLSLSNLIKPGVNKRSTTCNSIARIMCSQQRLFILGLLCVCCIPSCWMRTDNDIIPHKEVANWAMKFGVQMWEIGQQTTRSRDIQERYQQDAKVEKVDGLQMVRQMAEDVENMMAHKMEAVKRIMDVAEHASIAHQYDPNLKLEYYNAKYLNDYRRNTENDQSGVTSENTKLPDLTLTPSQHFENIAVNFSLSSVHVPTNVYDGASDVKNAIKWSEHLNRIFASNYELDPSLSWQYFGSAHGFMRQYPATKWPVDEYEPDLFDCRVRPWYIQAAASPKDMMILVDTSGSMTGVRREIAKHVVLTLLDTLSDNDFVNIYKFSETPEPVDLCFQDKLVQANMENVRRLKSGLDNLETTDIANFTSALSTAFEILHKYNRSHQGCQCNQAIMVVTDGAPSGYKEVFERYNWPHKPVRVFTYLIGREVTDTAATNWMACANKGYFVHVTTPAEVREQVLKYIPVLARPMVMYQKEHPLIWTPVYADVADPKSSDWMWEVRERSRQRNRTARYKQWLRMYNENSPNEYTYQAAEAEKFLAYGKWGLDEMQMRALQMDRDKDALLVSLSRSGRDLHDSNDPPARYNEGEPHAQALTTLPRLKLLLKHIQARMSQATKKYRLVTSVATPVFDRKNYTNITERTLINDAVWEERIRTVRTANLLGVAGTDVPISDITKLTPSYKLGVNGYAFAITNNGYLVFHPDFRPVYQDILKPNYNGVDLSEIELVDNDAGPRDNDSMLMSMRREMVDRREGETPLRVRIHYDQMKRATVRRQKYYYRPIQDTPFSLGIALPEDYGHFRVKGEVEIKRTSGANVSMLFQGKNWKVHPDWVYCEYNYDLEHQFNSPEEAVLHFVVRTQKPGWKWKSNRAGPKSKDGSKSGIGRKLEDAYYCDKDLIQALIFDAQVTEIFDKRGGVKMTEGQGIYQMFGINVVFVATRSGLTRWQDAHSMNDNTQPFPPTHPRSRRARRPFRKRLYDSQTNIKRPRFRYQETPPKYVPKPLGHFSETNKRTADEVWYKRAVEQHHIEPDSYVFSVPFDAGLRNDSLVTATHAIYVEHNGHKAPAAVVGLQYKHSMFSQTFFNISSGCTGAGPCGKTCKDEALECYVLDNSGFVVISEDNTKTGQFFGDIDGMIMDSLVYYEVYQKIRIYDYQAVCFDASSHKNDASFLLTPIRYVKWLAHWFVGRMAWMLLQTQIAELINSDWAYAMAQEFDSAADEEDMDSINHASPSPEIFQEEGDNYNEEGSPPLVMDDAYINRTRPVPCDKQTDLYALQPDRLKEGNEAKPLKGRLTNCSPNILHSQQCGRSFSAHKIPHTNLLLLVVDTLCPCETRRLSIEPTQVIYNETQDCERLREPLYRQRPGVCISYHPEEEEIKLCGGASQCVTVSYGTVVGVLLISQVMLHFS